MSAVPIRAEVFPCLSSDAERAKPALQDAMMCMGLQGDWRRYYHTSEDRLAHYHALHERIRGITPAHGGFCWLTSCGPWIDDVFASLPWESFGPFVPLHVPWTKIQVRLMDHGRMSRLVHDVLSLLHEDYLYVAVTQDDGGLGGERWDPSWEWPRQLFVLSQGGIGHVPVPLWLTELAPRPSLPVPKWDFVFCGNTQTHRIRRRMMDTLAGLFGARYMYTEGYAWKEWYSEARVVMSPRGYGRNSYRLLELLQMGMVPYYVYSDIIWLPYYDSINWSEFAFVSHIDSFREDVLRVNASLTDELISRMRLRGLSLRDSHFTRDAAMRHVVGLLTGGFGNSDLRCSTFKMANGTDH